MVTNTLPLYGQTPTNKEQENRQLLNEALKITEDMNQWVKNRTEKFNNQCGKAFGDIVFCKCLGSKTPVIINFKNYIDITITNKNVLIKNIGSKKIGPDGNITWKEIILTTLKARNACIIKFVNKNALREELSRFEKFYLAKLQKWIDKGGDPSNVQNDVLKPCSKLVMLTATSAEQDSFNSKTNIKEYDFRASFCMKATVNKIHPQPEFKNRKNIEEICRGKVKVIKIVCKYFKLL